MPLTQITGLVAAGLLTTTSLVVGASTATDDDGPRVPCGAVWSHLPQDLREDLAAVRDLPAGERAEALRGIRRDALAGEYGERVEQVAERRVDRVRAVRRALPDELRADLRDARRLTGEQRADAFREVRDDALGGEYGEDVQRVAETVAQRREACGAQ
jgi:hypothetical protein